MKLNTVLRTASGVLALAMAAGLTGCGATATIGSESTAESAATATAAPTDAATGETSDDAFAYLADFSISAPFDENGYLADVKASDFVTLPENYDSLTLPAEANTVAESDITDYINSNVLANYTTTEQVTDRAAADGDSVNIDFVGTIDGTEFSGGNSNGNGSDLTIGSGSFIDDFEQQIIGHTPGETFDVNVTFPDPYTNNPDLAGKDAVFSTTLHYISEEKTPELTDAWVAENLKDSLGVDTVEALKADVQDTLLFSQQADEVFTQLVENSTIAEEAPTVLTDYLRDNQLYTVYRYATMYGTDVSTFLSSYGYDDAEAYLDAAASTISNMTKQILIMQTVAEQLGVTCDSATLDDNFETYFGTADEDTYKENYGENYLKMNILHNLVMDRLITDATKE